MVYFDLKSSLMRILFLMLLGSVSFLRAATLPPGFVQQELVSGVDPSGIELLPDGRVLVIQKFGVVSVFENGELLATPFLQVEVDNNNERGLLGLIIDPEFESNQYVYVLYSTSEDFNRVSRFRANGNQVLTNSELVLYEFDRLGSTSHNGGAMVFGNDGKLYVSSGDAGNTNNPQDISTDLGKMIRINSDGTIPSDNPYYSTLSGKYRSIYAIGFRNPFSITVTNDGVILLSDVGQDTWEEINEIESGKNYGWPLVEGYSRGNVSLANYKDPLYAYRHSGGACAIVGLEVYEPSDRTFPPEYWGNILYADFCRNEMYLLNRDGSEVIVTLASDLIQLTVIEIADNGDVYYVQRSNNSGSVGDNTSAADGKLFRITYTGSGAPFISRQPDDFNALIDEDALFSINVFGDEVINYEWYVNDVLVSNFSNDTLIISSLSLADSGSTVYARASNALGTVYSDTVTLHVVNNTRPVPVMTVSSSVYKGGDTLWFRGSATDAEDGVVTALNWTVDFHHDDHTHPVFSQVWADSSGFVVPRIGETATNVWFRIYLNAIDSDGFTSTVYQEVFPLISEVTVQSDYKNAPYLFDGGIVYGDTTFTSVAGVIREIALTNAYTFNGDSMYVFEGYENGITDIVYQLEVPENDTLVTLSFTGSYFDRGEGVERDFYENQRHFRDEIYAYSDGLGVINYDWLADWPNDWDTHFYGRFHGYIKPVYDGEYIFTAGSDDGLRLYLNNELIIDEWNTRAYTEFQSSYTLNKDSVYPLTFEYYQGEGAGSAKLYWEMGYIKKEIIPSEVLLANRLNSNNSIADVLDHAFFPNPVTDILSIKFTEDLSFSSFEIRDMNGRLMEGVVARNAAATITNFDLQSLEQGVYIITVILNEDRVIKGKVYRN